MKTTTGVKRLDDLLDGGVAAGSAILVYGPPFIGKEVLARMFLLHGLATGIPGVMLTTNLPAGAQRQAFAAMDPRFPAYEQASLLRFIDTYSRSVGGDGHDPGTEYIEGPMDLNSLSAAVNNAQRGLLPEHPEHRLVLDSVSTLVAYTNAQTAFRFLQVLVGRVRRAGATTVLLLERGMHSDTEVQAFKHLVDGVVEVRTDNAKNLLHVEGLGVTDDRGWLEYRFTPRTLEITGSFAAGRIR